MSATAYAIDAAEVVAAFPVASTAGRVPRPDRGMALVCLGFLLHMAAFLTAQGLQTSINKDLGVVLNGVVYAAFGLSALAVPALLPRCRCLQGVRLRMCLSASADALANLALLLDYSPAPAADWLLPAAINAVAGFGAMTIWSAHSDYMALAAAWRGQLRAHRRAAASQRLAPTAAEVAQETAAAAALYTGLTWASFMVAGLLGACVALYVLRSGEGEGRSALFLALAALGLASNGLYLALPALPQPTLHAKLDTAKLAAKAAKAGQPSPQSAPQAAAAPASADLHDLSSLPAAGSRTDRGLVAAPNSAPAVSAPEAAVHEPRGEGAAVGALALSAAASPLAPLRLSFRDGRMALLLPGVVAQGMGLMLFQGSFSMEVVVPKAGLAQVPAVYLAFYAAGMLASNALAWAVPRHLSLAKAVALGGAAELAFCAGLAGHDLGWLPSPGMPAFLAAAVLVAAGDSTLRFLMSAGTQWYFAADGLQTVATGSTRFWMSAGYAFQAFVLTTIPQLWLRTAVVAAALVLAVLCVVQCVRRYPLK